MLDFLRIFAALPLHSIAFALGSFPGFVSNVLAFVSSFRDGIGFYFRFLLCASVSHFLRKTFPLLVKDFYFFAVSGAILLGAKQGKNFSKYE